MLSHVVTDHPMPILSRDELAEKYLAQLPYPPYPVQEEALLSWFTAEKGVLVCAPTGTGKTLIAEAALFEALHSNTIAYYTTPLIALTEQKFREMQAAAIRWGFKADDVGLVTGKGEAGSDFIAGGSGLGADLGDVVTDRDGDINEDMVLVFNDVTMLFEDLVV